MWFFNSVDMMYMNVHIVFVASFELKEYNTLCTMIYCDTYYRSYNFVKPSAMKITITVYIELCVERGPHFASLKLVIESLQKDHS